MQSKYKFFAGLAVSFSVVFAMLILFSPEGVKASTINPGEMPKPVCVATSCGSTAGTKIGCPTVSFSATKERGHWGDCPCGYEVSQRDVTKCVRFDREPGLNFGEEKSFQYMQQCGQGGCMDIIDRPWIVEEPLTFGPIEVEYKLIYVKGVYKCALPFPTNIREHWVVVEYYKQLDLFTKTIQVRCNDAPFIACEEECPTECGYEGGYVADGKGGEKYCEPTNSCSTYRWCSLNEESPTGYMAEAISIDIPSETLEGMAWETGMDKYCAYPDAGTCPMQCGYGGGDIVADGMGGTIVCPATAACPVEDTGDVLGATTVVLAKTGAIDKSSVYLMQSILLLVTGGAFIYVGKEYINR